MGASRVSNYKEAFDIGKVNVGEKSVSFTKHPLLEAQVKTLIIHLLERCLSITAWEQGGMCRKVEGRVLLGPKARTESSQAEHSPPEDQPSSPCSRCTLHLLHI